MRVRKVFTDRVVYIIYTVRNSFSLRLIVIGALIILVIHYESDLGFLLASFICVLFLIRKKFFCLFLMLFITLNLFFYINNKSVLSSQVSNEINGTVVFFPKVSSEETILIVFSEKLHSNLRVKMYKKEDVKLGDKITVNCSIEQDEDNYYKYLGVGFVTKNCKNLHINSPTDNYLLKLIVDIRNWVQQRSDLMFTRSTSSLVKGIILGDSSDIPEAIQSDYKNAGILHIVAVSGFNMSVVGGLADKIFFFIKGRMRILPVVLMLFIYLSVVGFDNIPALKAFFLICIIRLAKIIGRRPNPVYSTLMSSFLVTLIFPEVQNSISFQLSTAAGLAISIFPSKVSFLMVNLFILPIAIGAFGTVNTMGIISNTLILPLVEPLTYISIVALINPLDCLAWFSWLTDLLIRLIQLIAGLVGRLPLASINLGGESFVLLCAVVMLLFIMTYEINYKRHTQT